MSLSAVPTLPSVCNSLVATNINAGGMINFLGLAAINKPLSSTKAAISITICSSEVSFKSAFVVSLFLLLPPATVGWAVLNNVTPSPLWKVSKPVLSNAAALVCFV